MCFLLLVIYGYLNMSARCKWGQSYSEPFEVTCGTKQGGIISPDFFGIYVDEIVDLLKATGIGCRVLLLFLACILFADDLALLAPTRSALQSLVNVCISFFDSNCLKAILNRPCAHFTERAIMC